MYARKIGALMLSVALLFGAVSLYALPICAVACAEPAVSVGDGYVILLKDDGTAWAWGSNTTGQLGTTAVEVGAKTEHPVAVTMPQIGGNTVRFVAVSAGADHVLALATDGSVWAWGNNGSGQLGTGNCTNSAIPVQVDFDFGGGEVAEVAAGTSVSYARLKDGSVYSWGSDANGLLGNGDASTDSVSTPQKIEDLNGISRIYAGENNAAALTTFGRVYLWGKNDRRQSGASGSKDVTSPSEKSGTYFAHDVALGKVHSTILSDDSASVSLQSFGSNTQGQYGLGSEATATSNSTMLKPATLPTDLFGAPKAIVAGSEHMLMLTDSGAVYAWGNNADSRLGFESESGKELVPVRIASLNDYNIVSVDSASNLSVALDELGTVFVWGMTDDGVIGFEIPTALTDENGDLFNLGLPPIYREYSVLITAHATVPRPTYTVTIPATVQPDDLHQKRTDAPDSERISTTEFSVSATGLSNFFGERWVEVRLSAANGSFVLHDELNHTIDYTVYNSADGETPFVSGEIFATFRETANTSDTQTVTGRIEIDQSEIQFSGDYTDRVTFTVTLMPQEEEGGDAE